MKNDELKIYDIDEAELAKLKFAVIRTEKGDMKLELYGDEAPQAVINFARLAKSGFYDGLNFHRVIPNFVIQGGCPDGTGTGGPGWRIKCECVGQKHKHKRGALSMAHAGRDTGGSQFFVCHSAQPHLDGVHTVFGQIVDEASLKTLDSIKQGDKIEEAHMRTRALIARWTLAHADGAVELVCEQDDREPKGRKTYLKVNDYAKLRTLFGELLREIQRIKSEGDYEAARRLVEGYAIDIDADLHREILSRYAKLNIAPYKGFINPRLTLKRNERGEIVDVEVDYSEGYDHQMLRYSHDYGTL